MGFRLPKRSTLLLACSMAAVGCTAGDELQAGSTPSSTDLASATYAGAFDNLGDSLLFVALSDTVDLCGVASGSVVRPQKMTWLTLVLCTIGTTGIGQYELRGGQEGEPCSPGVAWASTRELVSSVASESWANSGSIAVEVADGKEISGGLSLQYPDGTKVDRAFSVPFCPALNK